MAGHRFRAASTVPALRTAQVGEVVAGHRHVLVTLEAKVTYVMKMISFNWMN